MFKFCILACILLQAAYAYQPKVVAYWGQGIDDSSAPKEQSLAAICQTGYYDIVVVAFVHRFPFYPGTTTYPGLNFAEHCGTPINAQNPDFLICPAIGADIITCQKLGVQILMSFGGGSGKYGFSSVAQAVTFAGTVWNMFLGGSDPNVPRPFGAKAILDGVDLDIEGGSTVGYPEFIDALRTHFTGASKPYYISSAPQCPFPDAMLGPGGSTALQTAWFDYVFVQFYNNNCGLNYYSKGRFNYDSWGAWASQTSINPNVKVFVGAPGSATAAGEGYVDLPTMKTITNSVVAGKYANTYGGIMIWSAAYAANNNNYGLGLLNIVNAQVIGSAGSPVSPITTGKKVTTPVTTAQPSASSSPSHSPSPSPSSTPKPITTSRLHASPSPSPNPTTPSSNSCAEHEMKCLTDTTYSMCNRGSWGVSQSCGSGTECTTFASVIYCI